MEDANPYAAPASQVEVPPRLAMEMLRREYLQREACAKGLSFVFIGIGVTLLGFVALLSPKFLSADPGDRPYFILYGLSVLAFAALTFQMALQLRRLNPKVRPWLWLIAVILALAFPIGTVAAAWIIYQFLSRKGAFIFSREYRAAISETNCMRARPSFINLLITAMLLVFVSTCIIIVAKEMY
jgi:hypothetical protein